MMDNVGVADGNKVPCTMASSFHEFSPSVDHKVKQVSDVPPSSLPAMEAVPVKQMQSAHSLAPWLTTVAPPQAMGVAKHWRDAATLSPVPSYNWQKPRLPPPSHWRQICTDNRRSGTVGIISMQDTQLIAVNVTEGVSCFSVTEGMHSLQNKQQCRNLDVGAWVRKRSLCSKSVSTSRSQNTTSLPSCQATATSQAATAFIQWSV